ncbi:MAG TPA: hypothetical protein VLW54_15370 [Candidatus Acidoferrales bacterium]|nr:hypothetical protein [Candidatus Acidoferrales bacterium]
MPATAHRPSLPHEAGLAIAIVIFHLLINVLHGAAHHHYEIPMEPWQQVYIWLVMIAAPLVAGALLVARRLRVGAWLLLVSLAFAALFNVYFHFLLIGPDNVSSISLDSWGFVFLGTAIFLAASEVWGVSVAFRLLRVSAVGSPKSRVDFGIGKG